jgi:hypothetical protein
LTEQFLTFPSETSHRASRMSLFPVSRLLNGILFDVPFDYAKFRATGGNIIQARHADRLRRLPQHLLSLDPQDMQPDETMYSDLYHLSSDVL